MLQLQLDVLVFILFLKEEIVKTDLLQLFNYYVKKTFIKSFSKSPLSWYTFFLRIELRNSSSFTTAVFVHYESPSPTSFCFTAKLSCHESAGCVCVINAQMEPSETELPLWRLVLLKTKQSHFHANTGIHKKTHLLSFWLSVSPIASVFPLRWKE